MRYIKVNDPREVYRYTKVENPPLFGKTVKKDGYRISEFSFPSPVKMPIPETNTVFADYFEPDNKESGNLCILIHGHGFRGYSSMIYFAGNLARNGVKTVLLTLPFHGKRRAQGVTDGTGFFVLDSVGMLMRFRQSVLDARAIIDFAENGVFGDVERISVAGLSLGGMISVIAMGVDERIEKGVFVISGGDIEGIFWKGLTMLPLRRYVYRMVKEGYDISSEEREYTNISVLYDPLTFAKYIPPRKVMMFNGMFDIIIPHFASEELASALGVCPIYLPAGHGSVLIYRSFILRKMLKFLKE